MKCAVLKIVHLDIRVRNYKIQKVFKDNVLYTLKALLLSLMVCHNLLSIPKRCFFFKILIHLLFKVNSLEFKKIDAFIATIS